MRIELYDIRKSIYPFSMLVTGTDNNLFYLEKGLEGQVLRIEDGQVKWADVEDSLNITQEDIDRWNTAYSWGDHHIMGYLTTESDPTVPYWVKEITQQEISDWNEAHSWGDHHTMGYLTEETDPTVPDYVKEITQEDINNWNNNGEDKFFHFNQPLPAQDWYIVHNLNKMPSVQVIDSAGTPVRGAIEYIDVNSIFIHFNHLNAGDAYLN